MALFKGDAQLLWNQFSELREPQVKSFYPFFKSFSCFFYSLSCFPRSLAFSFLYVLVFTFACFILLPIAFLVFLLTISIYLSFVNRCFLPQDTSLEICSSQTIFPISCMIKKWKHKKLNKTLLSQNLTKISHR